MSNKVEPKTLAELEAMHTGSLMSRRKALFKCDESFKFSDQTAHSSSGMIEFKDTPLWKQANSELLSVLSSRENIPSKKERKAMRQAKARKGK